MQHFPLGDILAAIFRWTGIERLVKSLSRKTGRKCGCKKRQQVANGILPIPQFLQRLAKPKPVTIRVPWAPGDNVVATGAIYELAKAHPGRFAVTIRTHYPQIWENTPHIVGTEEATNNDDGDSRWHNLDIGKLMGMSTHSPVHYLEAPCLDLSEHLNLPEPLRITEFHGHIYLSEEERTWQNQVESELGSAKRPWWLIVAGGKADCTCKWYPPSQLQDVVDYFEGTIQFVQVGDSNAGDSGGHQHFDLKNVLDLRGKTDHGQLRRLVYHCDGVVCGNSYLMHLAAAVPNPPWRPLNRPCVVLAGGREPVNWFQYPSHQVLHTIGQLSCCASGGCWKDRVEPIRDGRPYDHPTKLCRQPKGQFARCMADISPWQIIQTIEGYLRVNE